MTVTWSIGSLALIIGAVGLAALLSSRLTSKTSIPSAALFLVGAAIAAKVASNVALTPSKAEVDIVTFALVCILFEGGMQIGLRRFKQTAAAVTIIGLVGTFLTAAAGAILLHAAFGLSWYLSALCATAVAPTDPAVVFSVLGRREITGRSGTILEGESGANDPVGIALMASLLSAGSLTVGTAGHIVTEFILQMGVGTAIGIVGGWFLLMMTRNSSLPSEGLYMLRSLASILVIFGVASLAHGSGFLSVFIAGILVGDQKIPYKRDIQQFHAALASLGEIVAFIALGLTVDLSVWTHLDVWEPGLVLGAALAILIRPVVARLCLVGSGLPSNERRFIMFAGLKGAVPILLATTAVTAGVFGSSRLYGIVVVVVFFSVLLQGGLVPYMAKWFKLPVHQVQLHPWSVGIRLRDEPEGVHRFIVRDSSAANGRTVHELKELIGEARITLVARSGHLISLNPDTALEPGDEVIVVAEPSPDQDLWDVFEGQSSR